MRACRRAICALLCLPLLVGCVLLRGTPTPLPWILTRTPEVGVHSTVLLPTATMTPGSSLPVMSPTPALPTVATTVPPDVMTQQIILESPQNGETVGNPLVVRGRTTLMPFEATLVVRVYDAWGQLAALTPMMTRGEYGQPATFEASVFYGGVPGAGWIEVVEISARDGSDLGKATTYVTLAGFSGSGYVEVPALQSQETLPLRVLAHVGRPGEQVNVTVTWADGTQFGHLVTLLPGLDGRGLAVTSLDWVVEPRPTHPPTQGGAVHIHDSTGQQLAWQPLTLLHPSDPDTMNTNVYWVRGDQVQAQPLRIPRTQGIGRASLECLLWGPVPQNLSGFQTAIPLPEEILAYTGRGADWGERVRVNTLTIIDGVARVDFSKELLTNPGGAARMLWIRQQIELTLLQFSSVNQVIITVEGQPGLLEP
jgi:hypothetical protein